jgi:hypothetical protein
MRSPHNTLAHEQDRAAIRPAAEQTERGQLEVNVIYTNPKATAAALKSAALLARDLGACIQLKAVMAVPVRLPLDHPPVSISFVERLLARLVGELGQCSFEPSVHLYLCRDQRETLRQILQPNSLVVIGGRNRWWPTAESRMAQVLRSQGHRVVFVPLGKGQTDAIRN